MILGQALWGSGALAWACLGREEPGGLRGLAWRQQHPWAAV